MTMEDFNWVRAILNPNADNDSLLMPITKSISCGVFYIWYIISAICTCCNKKLFD